MPNPAAWNSDPVTRPRPHRPVLVAIPGADGSVLRGLSQATNKSGNSLEKAAENLANLPAAFQNLLDHFSERTASAEILRQNGGPPSAKMTCRPESRTAAVSRRHLRAGSLRRGRCSPTGKPGFASIAGLATGHCEAASQSRGFGALKCCLSSDAWR